MAIRGIIFDKDGTLFDFEATWAAWAAELLGGLFDDRAADAAASLGFDLAARRFAPDSPVIAETTAHVAGLLLPRLPDWDMPRLMAHMKALARAAPLAPAVPLDPLLSALAGRGLALGVVTNDDESSARAQLSRAGVEARFDFIAGYDSGYGGKPAPGPVLAFLDRMRLPGHEVAIVGDSLHDLAAGRAGGVRTVGVLTGPARAEALWPLADAVLPDIGHLPAWIDAEARETA